MTRPIDNPESLRDLRQKLNDELGDEKWNEEIGEKAREWWEDEPAELGLLLLSELTDEHLGSIVRSSKDGLFKAVVQAVFEKHWTEAREGRT